MFSNVKNLCYFLIHLPPPDNLSIYGLRTKKELDSRALWDRSSFPRQDQKLQWIMQYRSGEHGSNQSVLYSEQDKLLPWEYFLPLCLHKSMAFTCLLYRCVTLYLTIKEGYGSLRTGYWADYLDLRGRK